MKNTGELRLADGQVTDGVGTAVAGNGGTGKGDVDFLEVAKGADLVGKGFGLVKGQGAGDKDAVGLKLLQLDEIYQLTKGQ